MMTRQTIRLLDRDWLRSFRRLARLVLVLMVLPLQQAQAGDYPERTIKIVVPFPAGGPTDVAARLIANSLADKFGKGVVVENHPGAGGRIGAKVVATATADGYTLLLGGTNVNAIGAIYTDLGFDPVKSFAPVGVVCVDSLAIALSPKVPANDFKEFIAYAKGHPGQLKYGASPGIYTQFAGEYFKLKTGTDILFVPYKGGAPAVTDALGGHIEMLVNNKSNLLPQLKDGKLKALAVTSRERWPELPQIPTMREVGITGFPQEVLFGLLAPAGTPQAIVMQLNHAINEALQSAEVRASLDGIGVDPRIGTPEAFAAALDEQAREWKRVIEETGIQVE
jgi:tripartite-type tricarboxylate transporter receptor subunit TctC